MLKMYHRLIKFRVFHILGAPNIRNSAALVQDVRIFKSSYRTYRETNVYDRQLDIVFLKRFCTSTKQDELSWKGPNQDIMLKKLESALLDCKDYEAWPVFSKFKSLYGIPPPAILSKVISGLSYSSDHSSLPKACNLIFKIAKENSETLEHDCLSRLCLSLVRAQMPVLASKVLRLMMQRNSVPPTDMLCSVFMHMVKTEAGTCLASNILLEICDSFHHLTAKGSECAMSMKPSTIVFNLILEACVRSGSSLKAQQIIEAMARIRVVADVHSVLLFTYIYEMNGLRDELKRFKEYVDRVSLPIARHYVHFYDKLLSLHYDFDDIDAAASLVTDIYLLWDSRPLQLNEELMKPCKVPIGSPYLKEGLNVKVMFELLQKDFVVHVKGEEEYIAFSNGKFVLTSKGLARLIIKYKRKERIVELSELLVAIQNKMGKAQEEDLCCDVIHACIDAGCLETAHDILDDMEIANVAVPTSTYILLLNAYCKENMSKEAEALVKQMKRSGLFTDASDEMLVSQCLSGVAHGSVVEADASRQSELAKCLVLEMNRNNNKTPSKVYELNSSMYFFCKAKMMEDAQTIYRKMHELNIQPTVQTFAHLVQGYLSLEMYREITILWGDIKRFMDHGYALASRDLYELLLLSFLRGGYFERVLEVLRHMREHGIYADRWMYNQEFVRIHKNLYRKLKATDVRTEAQRLRLEHVKAFRKWVRNN